MSSIRVGGGFMGLLFAVGTVYIFVVGIPAVRGFFVWSLITGVLISLALHLFHKHRPTRPRTILDLSADVAPTPAREGRVRRFDLSAAVS
ncbi:MAG TPA: hypothetical protein VHA14_18795 [Bryobacteraceae bacterium]|nr:hypothetical protein [Bryobacteraceae bacterium]